LYDTTKVEFTKQLKVKKSSTILESTKQIGIYNQYINRENKLNFAKLISDITKNDQYLNCFINNFYLN
jgi:hypothetical protein